MDCSKNKIFKIYEGGKQRLSQARELIVGRLWLPRAQAHGKKAAATCAHFCADVKGRNQGHSQRAPK